MASLELRNKYGQIDLAAIDPAAVAELSDAAQSKLATLIDAVQTHDAAQVRRWEAVAAVRDAEIEQQAAMRANQEASDPFPFHPPDMARYDSKEKFDAAMIAAREMHANSVREFRAGRERRRAAASYVPQN